MNDAVDLVAIARLFQNIPRISLLTAFASIVPLCEAQGLLRHDQIRPILAALTTEAELPRALLGVSVDELFHTEPREAQIDGLYAELHALAASSSGDPELTERYHARLARLRELQEAEAREMTAFAEHRRALPRGAVDALLGDVDQLLERHEHPTGSDRAGGKQG
jgi:hypothetical protein